MNEGWNREDDWYWEGNIQAAVLEYMQTVEGLTILSSGQPSGSDKGLEIVAEQPNDTNVPALHRLVSVRGWPRQPLPPTSQRSQRRIARPEVTANSWMSQLVFDLCLSRGADPSLELAIALPTMASYVRYLQRLRWFLAAARVSVYLISQEGRITVTPPGSAPANLFVPPSADTRVVGMRRKLGLPGSSRLQLPLLHVLIQAGGIASRTESIEAVAQLFPEVPKPPHPDFGQRVSVAQNSLQDEGLTAAAGRGRWQITDEGRQVHETQWQDWLAREGRS